MNQLMDSYPHRFSDIDKQSPSKYKYKNILTRYLSFFS